jgi:hypothetical protein
MYDTEYVFAELLNLFEIRYLYYFKKPLVNWKGTRFLTYETDIQVCIFKTFDTRRETVVYFGYIRETVNVRKNGEMQKKLDCNDKISRNYPTVCVKLETTGFKNLRLPETKCYRT